MEIIILFICIIAAGIMQDITYNKIDEKLKNVSDCSKFDLLISDLIVTWFILGLCVGILIMICL